MAIVKYHLTITIMICYNFNKNFQYTYKKTINFQTDFIQKHSGINV